MTINQRVQAILSVSKAARNSDKELWLIYAQKSGMNLSEAQKQVFRDMPSPETIRRVRQKLQEVGKYSADHEVNEARYRKFKSVRANIKSEDPEKLLEQQGIKVLPWGR